MKTRGESLRERLDRQVVGLPAPEPFPEEAWQYSEPVKLAYCPLLAEKTGKGLCGDVDCRNCPFLEEHLGGTQHRWLCSTHAPSGRILPYWSDGHCEECGLVSCVLLLTI